MNLTPRLEEVQRWNHAYRNGKPEVSDSTYDQALDRLIRDARANPNWTGARDVLAYASAIEAEDFGDVSFDKFPHPDPMLSQNKARNEEEFKAWWDTLAFNFKRGPRLYASLKLDGFSIALYYVAGQLTRAVTRGKEDPKTGQIVGYDITRNVRVMKGAIPTVGAFTGRVRAEGVLLHEDWKAHFPDMVNPRNGAVGIAKREDATAAECVHLTVMAYEVLPVGWYFATKAGEFAWLKEKGFQVPEHKIIGAYQDALDWHAEIAGRRASLGYDIDGIVFEENVLADAVRLGVSGRGPVASVAFKFGAEEADAALERVEWSVGPTGIITPVAVIEPTMLAGATVRRASMANAKLYAELAEAGPISRNCLCQGDILLVSRRGDVIPKVERVVKNNPSMAVAYPRPVTCPVCKTYTLVDGAHLRCTNPDCTARRVGDILVWLSKLGIKDWGESMVQALYDAGAVEDVVGLYTFDVAAAREITDANGTRLGRKVDIAVQNLRAEMEQPLHTFLGSLNIPLMGRSSVKKIVDSGYDTLEKMMTASQVDFENVPGIGSERAASFHEGLVKRVKLIRRLLMAGITIQAPKLGGLSGSSFCFTGFRDGALEKAIENAGGSMKSSVGRGLTYLVAKDPTATGGKLDKARKLGTQVIGIEEARRLAS